MSRSARLRMALRLAALTPALMLGLPAQLLARRLHPPLTRKLPLAFHRYLARVLGLRVTLVGKHHPGGVLYVANHVSWLDIVVLGSALPVSFVAKSEVAEWPLFGTLARLQNTVFVDRQRRHATGAVAETLAARLARGDAMVLFAEGTTSDGNRILPFRSALLGAARPDSAEEGAPLVIRPLAIVYRGRSGLPLTRRERPDIAWYGDMDLVPHLKGVLSGAPIDVEVVLGEAMTLTHAAERKSAALAAERWTREALQRPRRA